MGFLDKFLTFVRKKLRGEEDYTRWIFRWDPSSLSGFVEAEKGHENDGFDLLPEWFTQKCRSFVPFWCWLWIIRRQRSTRVVFFSILWMPLLMIGGLTYLALLLVFTTIFIFSSLLKSLHFIYSIFVLRTANDFFYFYFLYFSRWPRLIWCYWIIMTYFCLLAFWPFIFAAAI